MIRLRNLDVSRIEREVSRLVTTLGWTEPLPLYRPAYSTRIFAYEDFINSILVILGSPVEGVQALQQRTGGGAEAIREDEQGPHGHGLTPSLGGVDGRESEAALGSELLPRPVATNP